MHIQQIIGHVARIVGFDAQGVEILADDRRLVVHKERKAERVLIVVLFALPIQRAGHGKVVFGVVGKSRFRCIEVDHHVTAGLLTVVVRLPAVLRFLFKDNLTGHGIGNLHFDGLCVPQQTCRNVVQLEVSVLGGGKRTILLQRCGLFVAVGENEADFAHVVIAEIVLGSAGAVVVTHHRNGGEHIRLQLFVFQNGTVLLLLADLKLGDVQKRSFCPVAVEAEIRNNQVCIAVLCGQRHKALDIHSVLELPVQILTIRLAQLHGCSNGHIAVAADRYHVSAQSPVCHLVADGRREQIRLLCHGLAVGGNALRHGNDGKCIGQGGSRGIDQMEGQTVLARLLRVISQRKLGLVVPLYQKVCGGFDGSLCVGKTCSLFSRRIGVARFVPQDGSRGHQKAVDHDHGLFCRQIRVFRLNGFADERRRTCKVRARHGSTRKNIIAAAYRGIDVAAIRGHIRGKFQIGIGSPGREITHERACQIFGIQHQRSGGMRFKILSGIHRNGACRHGGNTDRHADRTGHVVVNNDADSTVVLGGIDFFLKGADAALDDGNLSFGVNGFVVSVVTDTGNKNIIQFRSLFAVQHQVVEFDFVAVVPLCLCQVDRLFAVGIKIVRLCTRHGRNRNRRRIGCGRTDGGGIRVADQVGVAVRRPLCGGRGVGCRHDQVDACLADGIVNFVDSLIVCRAGKTAGRTEGHIDDVHTEQNRVGKTRKDVFLFGTLILVSEHLHDHQLCVDRNAGDHVILSGNDTRNVRTVVVDRVYVGILVGIVKSIGNFGAVISGLPSSLFVQRGRHEIGEQLLHRVCRQGRRAIRQALERAVRIVQSRIQHGHNNSLSGQSRSGRVVDTRSVSVQRIVGRSLGRVVPLRDHDRANLVRFLQLGKILVFDSAGESGEQRGVMVFDREDFLFKRSNDPVDSVLDLCNALLSRFGQHERGGILAGGFRRSQQGFALQTYNHGDLVVRLILFSD